MALEKINRKEVMISLYDKGISLNNIGKMFNVSRQRIYQIIHNKKKQHRNDKKLAVYKKEVLKRDNNKCVICGNSENIIMHHIDGDISYNAMTNLIIVCKSCHTKIHNKEQFNFDYSDYKEYKTITENLK